MSAAVNRSIDDARRLMAHASRPVSFSGAGLSAESGIPTFRGTRSGLWAKYDPAELASPQGFARQPEVVIDWYNHRRRMIAAAEPNPAHRALAARKDIVKITQNVDDLLQRAGAQDVVQLHGTMARNRCHAQCGHDEMIDLADPPGPMKCLGCGEPLRPSVVWFGEALPEEAWSRAEEACRGCDLLLVIGTSAVVYPAAGLIGTAKDAGARIIVIDPNPTDAAALADVVVATRAAEALPRVLE